jgi:hypothetical protein
MISIKLSAIGDCGQSPLPVRKRRDPSPELPLTMGRVLRRLRSIALSASRRSRLPAREVAFSDRHFLFRRNFVFRFGNSHQPMIEPANNVL